MKGWTVNRLQAALLVVVTAASLLVTGCGDYRFGTESWFDPSLPYKAPDRSMVNPIWQTTGVPDQAPGILPNASFPRAEDMTYREEDYVIGPGDILRISVLDLLQDGFETVMERQVSQTGYIDMLLLEQRVRATGYTPEELAARIKRAYEPDILRNASVSAAVALPRQNVFNMLGVVARPGAYSMPRKDFRLLEALSMAGDVTQVNLEYLYVIRHKSMRAPPSDKPPARPAIDEGPPTGPTPATGTGTQPALPDQLKDLEKFIPGGSVSRAGGDEPPVTLADAGTAPATSTVPDDLRRAVTAPKWEYVDGQWRQVRAGGTPSPTATAAAPAGGVAQRGEGQDIFDWQQLDPTKDTRVIAVDLEKLKAGDPRMNVVIRDDDVVYVPPPIFGEFYVIGEILRPGPYNLSNRHVTIKQAITAAGGLGQLAWPNNSVLTRRIGKDQEQMVPVRLQDIITGREPDMFLKPDDVLAVGSHWTTPFLAVWRNAFRMTYGFGFIYDRNYSEREFEIPLIWPKPGFRM